MISRFLYLLLLISSSAAAQLNTSTRLVDVDTGWAKTSVNAVVFRKNSLVSFNDWQYIAFYDPEQWLVIGKRKLNDTKWQLHRSQYKGNASDAHNSISIMVDGAGFLHVAWDHHNNPLNYCQSVTAGQLNSARSCE